MTNLDDPNYIDWSSVDNSELPQSPLIEAEVQRIKQISKKYFHRDRGRMGNPRTQSLSDLYGRNLYSKKYIAED